MSIDLDALRAELTLARDEGRKVRITPAALYDLIEAAVEAPDLRRTVTALQAENRRMHQWCERLDYATTESLHTIKRVEEALTHKPSAVRTMEGGE